MTHNKKLQRPRPGKIIEVHEGYVNSTCLESGNILAWGRHGFLEPLWRIWPVKPNGEYTKIEIIIRKAGE